MRHIALCFALIATVNYGSAVEPTLNEKVATAARSHIGKEVGDGECTSLATAALEAAGAKGVHSFQDKPKPGDYVWGELVFTRQIKDGKPVDDLAAGMKLKPGDIVQLWDAKFSGKLPNGGTYTAVASHHTAVITAVSKDGLVWRVLQQNNNGNKTVAEGVYNLKDLQSGWIRAYQPVAK